MSSRHDHNGHTRRAGILLCTGIEHGILGNVQRAADEIGGGVANQWNASGWSRFSDEFHAMDGFIGCEVQVGSVRVEIEIRRQAVEAFLFGVGCRAGCAELLCFLDGSLAPGAGDDVIGGGAGSTQVHGQHRKLQGRAALQEHDLVVGGNARAVRADPLRRFG